MLALSCAWIFESILIFPNEWSIQWLCHRLRGLLSFPKVKDRFNSLLCQKVAEFEERVRRLQKDSSEERSDKSVSDPESVPSARPVQDVRPCMYLPACLSLSFSASVSISAFSCLAVRPPVPLCQTICPAVSLSSYLSSCLSSCLSCCLSCCLSSCLSCCLSCCLSSCLSWLFLFHWEIK